MHSACLPACRTAARRRVAGRRRGGGARTAARPLPRVPPPGGPGAHGGAGMRGATRLWASPPLLRCEALGGGGHLAAPCGVETFLHAPLFAGADRARYV